jgi:hypothetical protein
MGMQRKPFDFMYPPPSTKSRVIPGGKDCSACWHFEKGLNCRNTKGVSLGGHRWTTYCHWPDNHFTTEIPTSEQMDAAGDDSQMERAITTIEKQQFIGNKDEMVLHMVLNRAEYQCECDGILCKAHKGRCSTLHVKRGGKSPLLLQPKDAKKSHSIENSSAMCATCATNCTMSKMGIEKKKKKVKQNEGQMSII